MPLNLSTGAALVGNTAFRNRVAMAFYFVADEVIAEDPATVGHENRERFARSVVFQPYEAFLQYAAMVTVDEGIRSGGPYTDPAVSPTDGVILTAVRGLWNTLANVPT